MPDEPDIHQATCSLTALTTLLIADCSSLELTTVGLRTSLPEGSAPQEHGMNW
jgi:hypothetical protein